MLFKIGWNWSRNKCIIFVDDVVGIVDNAWFLNVMFLIVSVAANTAFGFIIIF